MSLLISLNTCHLIAVSKKTLVSNLYSPARHIFSPVVSAMVYTTQNPILLFTIFATFVFFPRIPTSKFLDNFYHGQKKQFVCDQLSSTVFADSRFFASFFFGLRSGCWSNINGRPMEVPFLPKYGGKQLFLVRFQNCISFCKLICHCRRLLRKGLTSVTGGEGGPASSKPASSPRNTQDPLPP